MSQKTTVKKIAKLRMFFRYSVLVIWFFNLLSLIICIAMEVGWLPNDWLWFHRYVTRFANRIILVFSLESLIVFYLYALKREKDIPLSIYSFIFLGFLGSLIDNAGNLFGWFSVGKPYSVMWYDDFVHFTCAVIITFALFFLYYNYSVKIKLESENNMMILSLLAALSSLALGTLFGVYEYYSDMYWGSYMVGGVADAVTDNLFDIWGALVGFLVLNIKPVRQLYFAYRRS